MKTKIINIHRAGTKGTSMKYQGLILVVFLLTVYTLSSGSLQSQAQPSSLPHISSWRVVDLNGVDWTDKTLVAGGTYRISMTIT
ncbi:MAG: hypothetical protein QQN63_11080, partial [Nitrosopumilus sp.]